MTRAAALLLLLLACLPALAEPAPVSVSEDGPARRPDTRILDLTADVLEPGESEIGVFWARYSRGLLPGLQVSTHALPYLVTLVNASAKYQLLHRPELRLSVEASAWWFALGRSAGLDLATFPLALRGTVPLADNLELTLTGGYTWFILNSQEADLSYARLRAEATLVRHDSRGAFLLTAELPLLNTTRARLDSLLGRSNITGALTLDDVSSWSVLLARDHLLTDTAHVRMGVGYRNRPGILLIESIGSLLLRLDVYWR